MPELDRESLRNLAKELDSTGQATMKGSDTKEVDNSVDSNDDSQPSQDELEAEYKRENKHDKEDESETVEDESETVEDESDEEPKSSDTSDLKSKKERDRYDRNWKKLQEEKEQLQKERQELAEERKKSSKRLTTTEDIKTYARDDKGYSVEDYEFAAKKLEEDGEPDKAQVARERAKTLFVNSFMQEWNRNMNDMIDENPDLSDSRKELTVNVNKVLETIPFLRNITNGINYAVDIAKGNINKSLVSELKAENEQLKQQLEKISKKTRLSTSGPNRSDKSIDGDDLMSLTKEQRRSRLFQLAGQADRGQ